MKKILVLFVTFVLVFAFTACSEEKPKEVVPEDKIMEGIVHDMQMSTIAIEPNDGNTYTFSKEDAEVEGDINVGDTVSVTYTGDVLEGPLASKVNLIKSAPVGTGEISGVIDENTSMNVLVLVAADGNTYNFIKTDAKVIGLVGLQTGNHAEVSYSGDLNNNPKAILIALTDVPPAKPVAGGTVKGFVLDASMNNLTILGEDGNTYNFKKQEPILEGNTEKGLIIDGEVEVTYTGNLPDSAEAEKIVIK